MPQPHFNAVLLAELVRALQAEHRDADWHELEPLLRAHWERFPRDVGWQDARDTAAACFRAALGVPDAAPVVSAHAPAHESTAG